MLYGGASEETRGGKPPGSSMKMKDRDSQRVRSICETAMLSRDRELVEADVSKVAAEHRSAVVGWPGSAT